MKLYKVNIMIPCVNMRRFFYAQAEAESVAACPLPETVMKHASTRKENDYECKRSNPGTAGGSQ